METVKRKIVYIFEGRYDVSNESNLLSSHCIKHAIAFTILVEHLKGYCCKSCICSLEITLPESELHEFESRFKSAQKPVSIERQLKS